MDTASILTAVVIIVFSWFQSAVGYTDPNDASALIALKNQWQNVPPTWARSDDPCDSWEGIACINSRITVMRLSTMGIKGTLTGDLWVLTELQLLDLSYNKDLGGTLSPKIEKLKKLNILILIGCSFIGTIPAELGTLSQLSFLSLNSNKFTGTIPDSLGNLSNLYWLDIADNGLTGNIPVSSASSSGLDRLVNTTHFHLNKNQLSGEIPVTLFNSGMRLFHLLLDGNQFTGKIPDTIGLLSELEVLRLDRNQLTGPVPSSINNLTKVNELNLANNLLTGMVPDLSRLGKLNYVDLSNNSFAGSEVPSWFSTLPLTTLVVQSGGLMGEIPQRLFSNFQLQQVILSRNKLNGTLDVAGNLSPQLQLVDLQDNDISYFPQGDMGKVTIILIRNPVCKNKPANTRYCALQQQESKPYSTGLAQCAGKTCPADQNLSPNSCACAYPYKGIMIFRAPTFSDLTNRTIFQQLEEDLWKKLFLSPGSVSIQNLFFNSDSYLQLDLELFPSDGIYFNRSQILQLGFSFSNQSFKPAQIFGPYFFIASPYPFPEESSGKSTVSTSVIIAIAIVCAFLIMIFVALGIYAFQQKKRAEKAEVSSQPFAAWTSSVRESDGPPQLKGARLFSFNELNKCTNYFSQNNEIGGGGYGKVYRGTLPSGQLVAIKRAQQGSTQGPKEFKTEIELLSRVHHKNLVGLVGFCADHGEQMLVYEFVPNGTIRDSLSGKSGIVLDWKRRLRVALGSAKGLAYLHELADPPIIHRDVKSSNILLDENLNAKVADFGLSKLISNSEKGHVSTQVKGTMGYLDPEYYMTQQLTDKSDVYSFGVVMLELLTGKQPLQKGKYVVREARMMLDRNKEYYGLRDILDPIIRDAPNLVNFGRFVDLALRCVEETATNRPTMNEVVREIEGMLQQDGSNPTSASSSATELVNAKGAQSHPYNEPSTSKDKDSNSETFGYIFPARVEPK